jgi:preprotein translocase subunit YajC
VQDLVAFLPLIGIALVFWLLVIRPQARRQRELSSMQSALEVGDRLMLASGIHGTLLDVSDETVSVEIAPGVAVTVARGAIGKMLDAGPGSTGPTEQTEEN